jgi:hypothetical protein
VLFHLNFICNNFQEYLYALPFKFLDTVVYNHILNYASFQKLMGQEISKSLINKSLIAIKEHGVLFECTTNDGECTKKSLPLTYWVVG